eukprot:5788351-Prymnesium_polylepis.1
MPRHSCCLWRPPRCRGVTCRGCVRCSCERAETDRAFQRWPHTACLRAYRVPPSPARPAAAAAFLHASMLQRLAQPAPAAPPPPAIPRTAAALATRACRYLCLLYPSDAADDM